jgi:hypothetical protein
VQTAQKIAMAIIGVAMATALLLPGRQTPQVIGAFTDLARGTLATAMGTGKPV